MRRFPSISLLLTAGTAILVGCSREAPPPAQAPAVKTVAEQVQVAPKPETIGEPVQGFVPPSPAAGVTQAPAADKNQDNYEAALTEALVLIADRKYAEALVSLETARGFQDSDFIKGEIAKVRARLEQTAAAQKTVQDIETVLGEGKPGEAAKLAQQALKEFGDGEAADSLVKLRLQADALQSVDAKEDAARRHQRLRDEGEAALAEKNLRAAALAFEQALLAQDDARLKDKLAGIRDSLDKYDGLRKRAAELRRDPAQLDDAVEALKGAAQAWDTLQVRQEIDEYTLALQKRRDTVSVADFEVRAELGLADAGRTLAEELLPLLKPRFDLVERGQLARVMDELKLEAGVLDDPGQQREVGRLAKVRYLVLGSVARLGGLTINARLVDVRTGLVVQTAKVVVPGIEQLGPALPDLARQLLMSDEEKLAHDQEQIRVAKRPAPLLEGAPLPPPPPLPGPNVALAPMNLEAAPPPEFGGLRVEVFRNLQPAPLPGQPLPPVPVAAGEIRVKQRLLQAVVHLGDDLFRRGSYREANRHFEFALTLAPADFDVRLRVERARPLVPPPPPAVVVVQQPVVIVPARPRIAILNFMTVGDPRVVAPGLGPWTATHLAAYCRPTYEVVDAHEVYWYMAKLGMTVGDLMQDPGARRWLGRALNVRYFVLGTLQQTASFDATTYMIDAEYGFLQGSGRVHVRNSFELKLRLAELAGLTLMDPGERNRFLADAQRFEVLVGKGRGSHDRGEFSVAVTVFEDALRVRPGNVEVLAYLDRSRSMARQFAWAEERRRQVQAEEAARRRQVELAQFAAAARVRALQEAAAYDRGEQARRLELRQQAQNQLLMQARVAVQTKNVSISFGFFEGALGLGTRDDAVREFALARAAGDRNARAQAAQHEAAVREQRQRELAKSQQFVEEERQRSQAAQEQQKKIELERDKAAYQRAFDEAQRSMARGDYDAAVGALQLARQPAQQIGKADVIEALLTNALVEQAKGSQRAELEKKLAAERERRRQADQDSKQKEAQYKTALEEAQKALARKDLRGAQTKYQEAGKLFKSDAVLSGLRNVDTAQAQALAEADAAKKKLQEAQERDAKVKGLLASGETALAGQKFDVAVASFTQARKLAPDNVDVLAALTRAEQARAKALAEANRKRDDTGRAQTFQKLLKSGQDSLAAKQFDAAIASLSEAVKLSPDDVPARIALAQARKAQETFISDAKARDAARLKADAAEARKKADEQQRAVDVAKALTAGRAALAAKDLVAAEKAFASAAQLAPKDGAVVRALQDLQQARQLAQADAASQKKKQDDVALKQKQELDRAAKLKEALGAGQAALKVKNLDAAAKALAQARDLAPNDPAVLQGLRDLEQARKSATDAAAGQAAFQKAMQAGQQALLGKKYDDAIKAYQEAAKIMPGDATAQQRLQQAQKALAEATAGAQKQQQFDQLLKGAALAMQAKNYAAAQKSYQDALKLFPTDVTALRGLQDTSKLLETPKTPPKTTPLPTTPPPKLETPKTPPKTTPPPATPPPTTLPPKTPPPPAKETLSPVQKELQTAAALEKDRKYAEALASYQQALKLAPKDAKAKDGALRMEFTVRVLDGQKYLDMMKYKEAIREFEAALVLSPNHPTVTKLLARAKQMKK